MIETTTKMEKLPLPPFVRGLPFIGRAIDIITEPTAFADRSFQKYGNVWRTKFLWTTFVYVRGADEYLFVAKHEGKLFASSLPENTRKLFGNRALSSLTGDEYRYYRRILAQSLQPRKLASYREHIESLVAQHVTGWLNERELRLYPRARALSLDVSAKYFAGLDEGSQTELGAQLMLWADGLFNFGPRIPGSKLDKAFQAREAVLEYVTERGKHLVSEDVDRSVVDFLYGCVDEAGKPLPPETIRDLSMNLFGAGFEAITSAMLSFVMQVALHPDVKQRLQSEQDDRGEESTFPYLDAVLQECLRLTPPVGGGFRKVLQDCELNGFRLQKEWRVIATIRETHLNGDGIDDRQTFRPERFLGDSAPGDYFPFGAGMRECLGKEFARLELKVFCTYLVRHLDWELMPNQDLELVPFPLPRPKDGLKIRLWSRA